MITREAEEAIASADVLVGSGRLLDSLRGFGCFPRGAKVVELPVTGMADAVLGVLDEIASSGGNARVALVVSGDPGFYSLSRKVTRAFGRERVRALPGVSSLQVLACRLGRSWVGTASATLHGRELPDLNDLAQKLNASDALVLLLGSGDDAVAQMKAMAEDPFLGSAWAAVGWDLGLPKEQVYEAATLRELTRCPYVGRLALLWLERSEDD